MSISEVFRLHGRLRPDKTAIVDGDRRIDYRSLDRRIDGFANAMHDRGIRRGDFVGVASGDDWEHLVALFGLTRIGAVIVPMDHRWNDEEMMSVAEAFSAKIVITRRDRAGARENWVKPDDRWFDEDARAFKDPELGPDSRLILSLSSGTTGRPKGPCATHRQFENRFMAYWLNLGFNAYDRFVSATPLYFGGGRGFTWANLFSGATVELFPPPFTPAALVEHVRACKATSLFLVPTLIRRILSLDLKELAFPTVRCLISSGSALFPEERKAIREKLTPNLYEMYSSTEGGAVSVLGPEDVETHPDSVGRPCFRVEVEVVDGDDRPLPRGETGLMRYRSPALPHEFFGEQEGGFGFRNGWLYPGDMATIAEDGFLRLRGRAKDMIIRGGVNIYPGDIEQCLLRNDKVAEASVIGMEAGEIGEELVAFVVSAQPVDSDELAAWCKAQLAPYKVPKFFVCLPELPRNSGGKVMKAQLKEMLPAVLATGRPPAS